MKEALPCLLGVFLLPVWLLSRSVAIYMDLSDFLYPGSVSFCLLLILSRRVQLPFLESMVFLIPRARMGFESTAHKAEGRMGY